MIAVTHRIAGILCHTESDTWLPSLLEDFFEQFRVNGTKPDVYHRFHKVDVDSLTLPPPSDEERAHLAPYTYGSTSILNGPLLRSPTVRAVLQSSLERAGHVDIQLNLSRVIIRDFERGELDVFYLPVFHASGFGPYTGELHIAANYTRIYSSFLSCFSAALIHAAGVVHHNRAAIFVGPDAGGKSTTVGLSDQMPILHDDQIILRKQGDTVFAHSTPFGRNTSGPYQAPLGGIFVLEKASQFDIIPAKPAELVEYLWNGNLKYVGFLPRHLKLQVFDVLYDACHQVRTYKMRFQKDYIDWDAIGDAMANTGG